MHGHGPPPRWIRDWQTDVMTERKYRINAEQHFYKQEYCGCSYSLRDTAQAPSGPQGG